MKSQIISGTPRRRKKATRGHPVRGWGRKGKGRANCGACIKAKKAGCRRRDLCSHRRSCRSQRKGDHEEKKKETPAKEGRPARGTIELKGGSPPRMRGGGQSEGEKTTNEI